MKTFADKLKISHGNVHRAPVSAVPLCPSPSKGLLEIRQILRAPEVQPKLVVGAPDDAFERVIYSESHDEVANGKKRVPHEINPQDPEGWYARKRSTMATAMVFTAPGIPMLFQGQEFLEGGWFRDTVPLDWDQKDEFHGIVRLYRDLIRLRLNRDGFSRGLCGQFTKVYHLNDERKIIAFHRWEKGGPADDVVVVANFFHDPQDGYVIGLPAAGTWKLRFNSDWQGYNDEFKNHPSTDVITESGDYDGFPWHAAVSIGSYSVLIFSQ